MTMTLRLDDAETEALRVAAADEGLSMQQAARLAIREWIERRHLITMAELMARPPLGGGRVSAEVLRRAIHAADEDWAS